MIAAGGPRITNVRGFGYCMENMKNDGFLALTETLIGRGTYRDTYSMRFDIGKVVKYEPNPSERWCNVLEYTFWQNWKDCPSVARWLAPCHYLSDNSNVLIMDRTMAPIADHRALPKSMPAFLTDLKPENFGYIGKRLVCHDYAFYVATLETKRRKIKWDT